MSTLTDPVDLELLLVNMNNKIDQILLKIDTMSERIEAQSVTIMEYDPACPAITPVNTVAPIETQPTSTTRPKKQLKRKYVKQSGYWENKRITAQLHRTNQPFFPPNELPNPAVNPSLFIRPFHH